MTEETKYEKYLQNLICFTYVKEILGICYQIDNSRCLGCQYNDPSQLHHDCLTNTTHDDFVYHFDEAFLCLYFTKIQSQWNMHVKRTNIPTSCVKMFEENFNWNWWRDNNERKMQIEQKIKQSVEILSLFN